MSLKDRILTARQRRMEPVAVPEWGDGLTVHVAVMSGAERDELDAETFGLVKAGQPPTTNYRSRTLARALRDADGQRIFDDADAAKLGEQDADVIGRLFAVASRLNGLDGAEDAAGKK